MTSGQETEHLLLQPGIRMGRYWEGSADIAWCWFLATASQWLSWKRS